MDEIRTKILRVFFIAIHSHLYSFALRFLFLQTHTTSYSFYSSVTVHCTVKKKGGKPDRKPYPLPYGFRNPYRNLKSENSQHYAQKPRRNCTFMNSASGRIHLAVAHENKKILTEQTTTFSSYPMFTHLRHNVNDTRLFPIA